MLSLLLLCLSLIERTRTHTQVGHNMRSGKHTSSQNTQLKTGKFKANSPQRLSLLICCGLCDLDYLLNTHTYTHTRMHARTHARTHTRSAERSIDPKFLIKTGAVFTAQMQSTHKPNVWSLTHSVALWHTHTQAKHSSINNYHTEEHI